MRNSLIISLFIIGCFACEAPIDQSGESGNFALSQLIDDQVTILGSETWHVNKEVLVNEAKDQLQQQLDSAALKGELAIFSAFDPGKSQFKNAFDITESAGVTIYTKKDSERQSLKWVEVEGSGDDLRITAEILEETSIYTNQKKMDLRIQSGILQSYALQGYQKMLFRDTTFFEMTATIRN